jgi:hypothetical protein
MPEKRTIQKARKSARQGKAATTQAGEFVHEEIRHVREGKHGARSAKQAIAIGLSKARRAGVKLKPPKKGTTSATARRKAAQDYEKGEERRRTRTRASSTRRSTAGKRALKKEGRSAASHRALSRQARASARKR